MPSTVRLQRHRQLCLHSSFNPCEFKSPRQLLRRSHSLLQPSTPTPNRIYLPPRRMSESAAFASCLARSLPSYNCSLFSSRRSATTVSLHFHTARMSLAKSKPVTQSESAHQRPYKQDTSRTVRVHDNAKQVERLAQTLTSAFEEDPLINYFHGSRRKNVQERNLIFYHALLRAELSRPEGQSTIHVSQDDACVAIWHHAGHHEISGLFLLRFFIAFLRCCGLRAFHGASVVQKVEKVHPTTPHMYLFTLGTHKERQGKGYGGTVISEMLKKCDQESIPAYVESSNSRNLPFYTRHGFELVQEIPGLPHDCPPIFAMWREPQSLQQGEKRKL